MSLFPKRQTMQEVAGQLNRIHCIPLSQTLIATPSDITGLLYLLLPGRLYGNKIFFILIHVCKIMKVISCHQTSTKHVSLPSFNYIQEIGTLQRCEYNVENI